MESQKILKLATERQPGQPAWAHKLDNDALNHPRVPVTREKLLCDLLKREAVRVMADITECPSDTIPAHLARLDFLRESIRLVINHEFVPGPDTRASGQQLAHPATLRDYLECLNITRTSHRAPAWVNGRDRDIKRILDGIEKLSGLVANRPDLVEFLSRAEDAI